ncbi:efflux RND transporter periplasmic adaptor subunit [Methyloradius palustris]|uniref:Cobalt transporter n=1 Tax=Methyloradius palustris TaxID=2778876 RepID=A0A8D5G2C4_9PROT|nr:efflux RND transporter periplasmic adaptor subunit [Methyloradius palustris]BCM24390.1 cobalt transporter [Methyloradius palustris]
MKRIHLILIVIILAVVATAAWYSMNKPMSNMTTPANPAVGGIVQDDSGKTVRYWYDPMVPEQKFDKPGKSPFMDMQLIPKYAEDAGSDNGVSIPSNTQQNLGMRIESVIMMDFGDDLTAVGRVEPDERGYYAVQTRIPGFVERLLVRAVGDPVRKGQKIAEIYAPELLAAQQEYLALSDLEPIAEGEVLKQAARNRLKLLGMTEGEIATISKNHQSSPRFGVYAPASGVVTELSVKEGAQSMMGTPLMQINDLSTVWLIAEIPERDASRVILGSAAEVRLQASSNQVLKGKVGYLYPMLDDTSRTLRVRIELANSGNQLRPGMYADVRLSGMSHSALAVPSESVISTGQRKVVIVKETHGFRPVEVITGQESHGHTEITQGLSEGEQVVSSGQFLIDSEASLSGVLARLSKQDATPPANMQDDMKGMDMSHDSMKGEKP